MTEIYTHQDILPFPRERCAPVKLVEPTCLGLLAGAGRFPVEFVHAAHEGGHTVYGLGVAGMASEELASV